MLGINAQIYVNKGDFMKKIVILILSILMMLSFIGCGSKGNLIGEWEDEEGDSTLTFYEGGTGEKHIDYIGTTDFTWETKGSIVYIYLADSRKTHSYTGPATGKYNEWMTGSAAHTESYKMLKDSSYYILEGINDTDNYKKVY